MFRTTGHLALSAGSMVMVSSLLRAVRVLLSCLLRLGGGGRALESAAETKHVDLLD